MINGKMDRTEFCYDLYSFDTGFKEETKFMLQVLNQNTLMAFRKGSYSKNSLLQLPPRKARMLDNLGMEWWLDLKGAPYVVLDI